MGLKQPQQQREYSAPPTEDHSRLGSLQKNASGYIGHGTGQRADSSKGTLEVLSRKRIQTIASNKNLSQVNNQSLTSAQGSRPRLLSLYSGKYHT